MAGVSWLAELASQSVCSRKRAACLSGEQHQSYVLYDRARGVALRFTFRRSLFAGSRGLDNGTGSAESAAPGGTALHQGTEARARAIEERRELNRVAGG